jgi:hypothetical protein
MDTIFWLENLKAINHLEDRRRWEDNIRTDFREVGWEGVDWIHLAEDRDQWRVFVNIAINLRFP